MAVPPPSAPLLQQAMQRFQARDFAGAQAILERLLAAYPDEANALHMLGLVKLNQGAVEDGAAFLERSVRRSPRHALTHLNLAKAYVMLARDADAVKSFREALSLHPGIPEAQFELGNALHRLSRLDEAEAALRAALPLMPGDLSVTAALGTVLLDQGRNAQAKALAEDALKGARPGKDAAPLWNILGQADRHLGDAAGALAAFDNARQCDPALAQDTLRADALDTLGRHDEAAQILYRRLQADPQDVLAQCQYNGLLYRLKRPDFLQSFDLAQPTPPILLAKASFLMKQNRAGEALDIYARLAAQNPDDVEYQAGVGVCQSMLGDFAQGAAALERAIALAPDNALLHGHLANTLLSGRDPQKAAMIAECGHRIAPTDQVCLALLGTAWRVMQDERDEDLNGYDHLIRGFDLEPPRGFADMDSFNAELSAYLDGLHPETREFIDQSLRGGTQTLNNLFQAGHPLVDRLQERITEALGRYIREMAGPDDHPYIRRRGAGFRMGGSWSSRLRDQGFHVNHIHPSGWISSCYYVAVPDAVQDSQAKQGWIKFGEPSFDAGLADPVRRAIQPRPGRLVLFPSYMWHGTVPFRSAAARTTIAFDAVPVD